MEKCQCQCHQEIMLSLVSEKISGGRRRLRLDETNMKEMEGERGGGFDFDSRQQ